MEDGPQHIGPDIDLVLDRVRSDYIQDQRVRLLREHAASVMDLRDAHRKLWEQILGREVRGLVMDGYAPRMAEMVARNDLAARKQELDAELEAGLQRLSEELKQKVLRLVEEVDGHRDSIS